MPGPRHRVGLTEALIVCGELILDGEVIALQRTIFAESDSFPKWPGPFITRRSALI